MTTKKTTTKKAVVKKTNKKSVSKKLVKKVAKKATIKKTSGAKKLVLATGADCFWVHNGPILKDMVELEKALGDMTEKMFAHHVAGKRNDFADWVEYVLKDVETATAIRKTKKPNTAHTVVKRQLKLYKSSKSK